MLGTAIRGVLANTAWLTLEQVLRMAVGLVVGAWTARHLGPTWYGELANVLAFLAVFQAVAALGLHGTVVRDAAREPARVPVLLGAALAARLAAGLACWLVAIGVMAAWHGPTSLAVVLTLLAGGTLVLQAADVVDLWFQTQGQNHRTVLAKLAAMVATSTVRVVLILTDAPVSAFAAAVTLEMLLSAAGLVFAYRRLPCAGRWRADLPQARRMLAECWPFVVSGLAVAAYSRVDQVIVREFAGPTQAGLYAAIMPLSTAWVVLPTALQLSLAPTIARLRQDDPAAYREALVRVFRLLFAIGLAASVATAWISAPLVRVLYGEAYAGSAPLLAVHAFTNVFVGLGIAQGIWVVNEGRLVTHLWSTLCAATLAVLANLWLVPMYGAMAAAGVAVAAQFIAGVGINLLLAPESFWLQVRAITGLRLGSLRHA